MLAAFNSEDGPVNAFSPFLIGFPLSIVTSNPPLKQQAKKKYNRPASNIAYKIPYEFFM